jgi:hypothetical protein
MSTLTAFYVNTGNKEPVVEQLKKLIGIENAETGKYPSELYDNYLLDETG